VEESSTPAGDAAGDSLYRAAALGRSTDAVAAADHDHLLYAK
jgi:hypothetical protein